MWGRATLAMLVSSTSMNAASDTTKAISQGLVLGFQSWSACVSVAAAALIQIPDAQSSQVDSDF